MTGDLPYLWSVHYASRYVDGALVESYRHPPFHSDAGRCMVAYEDYAALAARCAELRDLLSRCNPACSQLSHHHGEFHAAGEPCPVYKRIGAALGYTDADGEGHE